MSEQEQKPQESWVEHIENLANVLQESSIGELELAENGTEVIIRRQPGEVVPAPKQQASIPHEHAGVEDHTKAIVAPLTGVFYVAPSPDLPPFVKIGDIIQLEQVVALIEAMKVFNEVRADVAGRITQIVPESGSIVKKDDILLRIEPL